MSTELLPPELSSAPTSGELRSETPAPRTWYSGGPTSDYFLALDRDQVLIVMGLCAVFVWMSFHPLSTGELWSHLALGRWIVMHGSLPGADPFGATASEQPLSDLPWLAQSLGYVVWHSGGEEALALAQALLVTAGVALLVGAATSRVNTCWALAAGSACVLLGLPVWGTLRPEYFGLVCFPLVLWGSAELRERAHPLYWLAPLFALWANLDGSFTAGLAVLAIVCLAEGWRASRSATDCGALCDDESFSRAWKSLALALVGSCIHPLGPLALWSAGGAALAELTGVAGAAETSRLAWVSVSGGLFLTSLGVGLFLLTRTRRSVEVQEALLLAGFALLGCLGAPMMMWWAFVWPWVMAPHAASAWESLWERGDEAPALVDEDLEEPVVLPPQPSTVGTLLAVTAVFAALVIAPPSFAFITGAHRGLAATTSRDTPIYLAEELTRRDIRAPLIAPSDWADYFIWQSGGMVRPLAWSQTSKVDPAAYRAQQAIFAGDDPLARCDAQGVRWLVLSRERQRPLIRTLMSNPRVANVYTDELAVLLFIQPEVKKS